MESSTFQHKFKKNSYTLENENPPKTSYIFSKRLIFHRVAFRAQKIKGCI